MGKMTATPQYTEELQELVCEPAVPDIFNERFQTLLNNDSYLKAEMESGLNDLKKSVSDGKSALASAITGMGVSTAADDTFAAIAGNIEKIKPTINVGGSTSAGAWNGATFTYGQGGGGGTASINGKNSVSGSFSLSARTTTVGGNALASDVLSGKTFSSNNAGREVNGTMVALRLTRLFAGNHTTYSAYEGFANNTYSAVTFSNTPSGVVYIRFAISSGTHELWCRVGENLTSYSWKFTVSNSGIEIRYVGSSTNQWIQFMAYSMSYAHSDWV